MPDPARRRLAANLTASTRAAPAASSAGTSPATAEATGSDRARSPASAPATLVGRAGPVPAAEPAASPRRRQRVTYQENGPIVYPDGAPDVETYDEVPANRATRFRRRVTTTNYRPRP
ncbi:hypothetical protein [Pseudofrankia sp. DC12]|uniref:hypothetical protein n=1 Tax=Pseudofrankia sp. DC12 TaxID=683315 RepID=UPI0005F88491|nr:hypothetical protein [Pseudofrankia sp. DC12]